MAMVESKHRATSDPEARRRVLEAIREQKVEYVLFWFTDLEGHLKSFAITPGEIEAALDDGMGFDGSSITGFNAIEESDMVAIPDPETFQLMPWREGETRVARMICDIVTPDGNPYEGDPRYVLRRALERRGARVNGRIPADRVRVAARMIRGLEAARHRYRPRNISFTTFPVMKATFAGRSANRRMRYGKLQYHHHNH